MPELFFSGKLDENNTAEHTYSSATSLPYYHIFALMRNKNFIIKFEPDDDRWSMCVKLRNE